MTEQLVYLLVGLYFIGVSLGGMFTQPISRTTLVQFIYGVILVVLAFLAVHLLH